MTETAAVIGLGYVGLPLAVHLDTAVERVIGYDIDQDRIRNLHRGIDPTGEVGNGKIEQSAVEFTTTPEQLTEAAYHFIAVPTPVDEQNTPNLEFIEAATETVGQHIAPGSTVVLESTVFPGATRSVVLPTLESASGLEVGSALGVGYSPERIVPGDGGPGLPDAVKIVSGSTKDTREDLANLYDRIVDAGVHRAPSLEAAEAAKCIENIQRDLNIALVNELAIA